MNVKRTRTIKQNKDLETNKGERIFNIYKKILEAEDLRSNGVKDYTIDEALSILKKAINE